MQLDSAEDLISALRGCGLFDLEQFDALLRELTPLSAGTPAVLKHLVRTGRASIYQLKKVLNGKAAELFLGPFVITDRLGSGGMGKVYRARDAAGRQVALKVVRPGLIANPTVRGRYAREVQTTYLLDHPNIVRLLDSGEADGKFYLAMEFVDGIDLARLMHDYRTVEVPEACEYVRQAALGLAHAHERGFVHRDIKPSNIVVSGERHLPQATEPAVVKLLDLGLARAIDPDDMVAPDLTRDHTVVGTPDYMAPEQAKNSKQVDARADLYSLGCTLYFLLTGRVPFPTPNAVAKILAHQSELPLPVQALRPEVPAAVAEIVTRLMSKRPDERIQTAGELAALLEPYACYPEGTPPVEIATVRVGAEDTLRAAAHRVAERSGPPLSGINSSLGSVTPLGLSELGHSARRSAHTPVALSDDTPRPPTPEKTPTVPRAKRRSRRKPRPKETRPALWVGVALAGVAIVALMLWLVSNQ